VLRPGLLVHRQVPRAARAGSGSSCAGYCGPPAKQERRREARRRARCAPWRVARSCWGGKLLRHDPAGGSSGVGSGYTAAPGNWAPASRPVRVVGGTYRRPTTWCGSNDRRIVTAEPLSRAQAADGEAFGELTESAGGSYRRTAADVRIYQNRTRGTPAVGSCPIFCGSAASERQRPTRARVPTALAGHRIRLPPQRTPSAISRRPETEDQRGYSLGDCYRQARRFGAPAQHAARVLLRSAIGVAVSGSASPTAADAEDSSAQPGRSPFSARIRAPAITLPPSRGLIREAAASTDPARGDRSRRA
jgi:hypothetical protein